MKYAVALFQISPSILFGVHSPLPNSKSLHSSLWTAKGALSNRIFRYFYLIFYGKNVLKLQRWQSQSWVLVLVIAIGWGGRRVRAWSYFSYFLSIDINCKRNNTNTRSSPTLSFIIEESFVSLLYLEEEKCISKIIFQEMGWKLAECWIFSREKLKGFWGDWHFQGKVETFWSECWRSLHGSLFRQSAKCIFLLQNQNIFWYVLIFSRSFSDEVIAKCRTLNWEKGEMGKIYDLLFVRVVKMCSTQQFSYKRHKTGFDQ